MSLFHRLDMFSLMAQSLIEEKVNMKINIHNIKFESWVK